MARFFERWKRFARRIGDFQARALLTLFYFSVFAPFALLVRWGSDPLAIKRDAPMGWRPKKESQDPPAVQAERQF